MSFLRIRILVGWFVVLLSTGSAQEEMQGVPPLLLEALTKVSENFDRWAYTETRVATDQKGGKHGETVIRFDPSLPYAEQFRPLIIDGKEPTARQLKEYRKRGEKRGERIAKEEAEGRGPLTHVPRFRLNDGSASIDLARAVVVEETDTSVTYDVPLRKDGKTTIPVEKFQLLARVSKSQRAFENVALKVRGPFRVKMVVKVKSGGASLDFATVDPAHAPVLTKLTGDGTASLMFIRFSAVFDLVRSEFKRVKPYSERFGVKIGPLKALDF
jgi:hypothetical protein